MHIPLVTQQLIIAFESIMTAILATDHIAGKDIRLGAVCLVMPCQLPPAGAGCVAIGRFAAVAVLLVLKVRFVMSERRCRILVVITAIKIARMTSLSVVKVMPRISTSGA